jgi:hypothetical protein
LVVLQNLADLQKVQGLCSEICPASSRDAYQATSTKAKVFPHSEEEEYPVPVTYPGIKAEPKVSCVHVGWISQIQVSLVCKLCYSKELRFVRGVFLQKQRISVDPNFLTISLSNQPSKLCFGTTS